MSNVHHRTEPTKVSIEVVIAVAWSDEERCYYAWSPQLGCIRDGETEEQVIALFKEAIEVRLESWIERGSLENNLVQLGYRRSDSKGVQKYDRARGEIFDRSAAQAMTFSDSISLQRVEDMIFSPGVDTIGVR